MILLFWTACSKFTFLAPESLAEAFPEGLTYSLANFGHIPYGKKVTVDLVTARRLNLSEALCEEAEAEVVGGGRWVVAERGGCTFVHKAMVAEKAGFKGIVIVNNKEFEDENSVVMVSDGLGYKVNIPALLITKKNGATVLREEEMKARVEFDTSLRERVRLDLFLDNSKRETYYLVKDFGPFFADLRGKLDLQLNWLAFDKELVKDFLNEKRSCLAGFCLTNDQGADLLEEELLEHFLFQQDPNSFFQFIRKVDNNCEMRKNRLECAVDQLSSSHKDKVLKLVEAEKSKTSSTVMEGWRDSIFNAGVTFLPGAVVNNVTYRGELEAGDIYQLLCNSLVSPTKKCMPLVQDPQRSSGFSFLWFVLAAAAGGVALLGALMCLYRAYTQRKMKREMSSQVNTIVSQYMAYYQKE